MKEASPTLARSCYAATLPCVQPWRSGFSRESGTPVCRQLGFPQFDRTADLMVDAGSLWEWEMQWKRWEISRYSSFRASVRSSPSRPQVASYITRPSVLSSKRKMAVIFIPRLFTAQRLSLCGLFRKRPSHALVTMPGLQKLLRHTLG